MSRDFLKSSKTNYLPQRGVCASLPLTPMPRAPRPAGTSTHTNARVSQPSSGQGKPPCRPHLMKGKPNSEVVEHNLGAFIVRCIHPLISISIALDVAEKHIVKRNYTYNYIYKSLHSNQGDAAKRMKTCKRIIDYTQPSALEHPRCLPGALSDSYFYNVIVRGFATGDECPYAVGSLRLTDHPLSGCFVPGVYEISRESLHFRHMTTPLSQAGKTTISHSSGTFKLSGSRLLIH
ncbi:hypothetical protein V8E53_015898 [Lactarius tabidus]